MAVVDADFKFIFVDIGAAADTQVWNTCELNFALTNDRLPVPPPEPLPFDNVPVPFN